MKVNEVVLLYQKSLKDIYDDGELNQIIFLVLEHVKNFSKTDLVMKKDETLFADEQQELERILSELKANRPVQYVLGYAWFSGMKLKVNEHVLIPRQETEELVEWIVGSSKFKVQSSPKESSRTKLKILDVCTGSGCIAIALKKEIGDSDVYAIDVSDNALIVARENSLVNQIDIHFIKSDILQPPTSNLHLQYDLIVSNPPYVLQSEKKLMSERVIHHEPEIALFVKDNDPLVFYSKIADLALTSLKENGVLYFEINEAKGNDITELLRTKGFKNIELRIDLNGKDRMIRASLN